MDAQRLKNRSIAMMVACSALWSLAGIGIKIIPWNPIAISGLRSLIAAGVIALYMRLRAIPFRFDKMAALGGSFISFTMFALVSANKLTTAANAIVLHFTAPVFILIISARVFKKRFKIGDYLVALFTLTGVALCFFDRIAAGSVWGNLLAVFSGFTYSLTFVITGESDSVTRMNSVLLGQIFCALIGLPFIAFTDAPLNGTVAVTFILMGIVQLGIPYILLSTAMGGCPPLVCCLVSALEPLLNPLWVFLLDGETPGVFALIGGLTVITSVTVYNIWAGREESKHPAASE